MASLFDVREKRFFDEKRIPTDVWQVLRTASLLAIPEFRVFEIAYKQWFGRGVNEQTIEQHYVGYMFDDDVPMWVRHFCKRILRMDAEGTLDPTEFGIILKDATREQQNRGIEYIVWIVSGVVVMVLLAELLTRTISLQCTFPPCY